MYSSLHAYDSRVREWSKQDDVDHRVPLGGGGSSFIWSVKKVMLRRLLIHNVLDLYATSRG